MNKIVTVNESRTVTAHGIFNTNNTKYNNTELNNSYRIGCSEEDPGGKEYQRYSKWIREQLEIDYLLERYPFDQDIFEGMYDLILETVLCKGGTVFIAKNEYPVEIVKAKFLKLNSSHLQYVMDCMRDSTSKVRNIKKYLLAALFNAPSTMGSYYQAEVNHDMKRMICSQ